MILWVKMLLAGRPVVVEADGLCEKDSEGLRSHVPYFSFLSLFYGWKGG